MDLDTKSILVRSLIENLELPKGLSLTAKTTAVGKDRTGSPEHFQVYEHKMPGEVIQTFQVYISADSVTLQYEYSTSCFQPFSGNNHVNEAVEDIREYLKKWYTMAMAQATDRRKCCSSNDQL